MSSKEQLWAEPAAIDRADLGDDVARLAELDEALRLDVRIAEAMAVQAPDDLVDNIMQAIELDELDAEVDGALLAAMQIDPPAGMTDRVLKAVREEAKQESKASWWQPMFAFAATFVVALTVMFAWPQASLDDPLAAELVAHIEHEPNSFKVSAIPATELLKTAQNFGLRVHPEAVGLRYMKVCPVNDQDSVHMVVEGDQSPVTIIVMPAETSQKERIVDRDGWKGLILPSPRGSMAIVGRSDADVAAVQTRVEESFEWY